MFARLDFSTFLVCCSGDLSDNESQEKPSVAICGGSICILTGLSITLSLLSHDTLSIVKLLVLLLARLTELSRRHVG